MLQGEKKSGVWVFFLALWVLAASDKPVSVLLGKLRNLSDPETIFKDPLSGSLCIAANTAQCSVCWRFPLRVVTDVFCVLW